MKIAICDDEFYQRNMLRSIVEKIAGELHIKIEMSLHMSREGLLEKLEKDVYAYDIILLDIQMKELTGIEVAKVIRQTNQSTLIIFITAVADFVFEGYNVRAFNYILKPIEEEKVKGIVVQAIKTLEVEDKPYYPVTTKEATYNVKIEEILYFKSDRRMIQVLTTKGEYHFYNKLDEIEEDLESKGFIRCHQRYLVNIAHIDYMSESEVQLKRQERLPISKFKRI